MTAEQIYEIFAHSGADMNENRNEALLDKYIIKRGHSPNGWFSLSNKNRIKLQMTPVGNGWDYVQLNESMFLWYEQKTIKKLIAYTFYPDDTTRAYYECDFHIESIIRRRIPPTVLTRKYCMICADNLFGREIRGFYADLGEKNSGKGTMQLSLYDKNEYFFQELPRNITAIWPFNKWLQRFLRRPGEIALTALPPKDLQGHFLLR
ncbi:MAG: hypothetical protein VB081_00115 [Christensenella sp.]|uniref:hypothetical protein n=1 Tax=Christensenella sp. TaxID=1935934 RepID=UPI002B209926|nr:hypothetical protein [Christensenella sp.]MEA5001891.1 hypothetical protein [Christensenella sp.]